MKQIKHVVVALIVTLMLIGSAPVTGDSQIATETPTGISPQGQVLPSATEGILSDIGEYLILQLPGQTTPARGVSLKSLLATSGIVSEVVNLAEISLITESLREAPLTIIDASVGSNQGANVSDEVVSLLIKYDRPIILLGEAGWLVHRLRGEDLPLHTAPVTQILSTPNTGAVYFSSPFTISNNSVLTSESLTMPVDNVQTEHSRLVNLTLGISGLPVLRYDSYPLDTFILGIEDPDQWTQAGNELLVNIIAYATALGESQVGDTIAATQSEGLLDGGLVYYHEPTLENTYYGVHSMYSLLTPSEWAMWRTEHQAVVQSVLDISYIENATTAGFGSGLKDTAMGLWLVEVMGLSSQFNSAKLVEYLAGEQTSGGFGDNVETTFHVTEALNESGNLGSIDTEALIHWLEQCKINGSESSDPDRWSAIGKNPTSIDPRNSFANFYLRAMEILGEPHDDPVKLTSWIQTRTAAGDGSYSNHLTAGIEPTTGTACALSSMDIMGTLESGDRTAGLAWFSDNQLQAGGFGISDDGNDLAGKTEETSLVAMCLDYLSEQSSGIALGIEFFVEGIETPVGFEGMDSLPSMMWGSWLSKVARLSHTTYRLDVDRFHQYIDYYKDLRPYPAWTNLTLSLAPEYLLDQYGTKSVWSQYYGLEMIAYTSHPLSEPIAANAEDFIVPCQDTDGHFRLAVAPGPSHMQYSTAAVETLYMLDVLGSISDRNKLESIVMTGYSSGTWSSTGWTLEPFAGTQEAIDWLSTRTALRLGLVNSTVASEIISVISSRIQYVDLWALSRDVATLALLDQDYAVIYSSIDTQQILDALGTTPFASGWYNGSELWQPVFTAGVLEMLSILGVMTEVYDTVGNSLAVTVSGTPTAGQDLDLVLSITSTDILHTVYVNAFGSWTQFEDVTNIDVISITIPEDYTQLGSENISVMLWDYGSSRAYDVEEISVGGVLQGDLTLNTEVVLVGDKVNGTVAWTLGSSGDAGQTLVKVRLGDPPEYQEWTYPNQESPFTLNIPTSDFDAGIYNLTITLNRSYCNELVLTDTVEILSPDLTYISSTGPLTTDAGLQVEIPWGLLFQSNDSYVTGQTVNLEIRDDALQLVHSDSGLSIDGTSHFYWTPITRGNYSYTISFDRSGSLEASYVSNKLDVLENTITTWINDGIANQYTTTTLSVQLTTENAELLMGEEIHVIITSPSMTTVIDTILTTNSTGYVSIDISLTENGFYSLEAYFEGSPLLKASSDINGITAVSSSTVQCGGITTEGLVTNTWSLWARLTDSLGIPIVGESVTIQVIFLPSTIVHELTLTTNATGFVSLQWTATNPGSYSIDAIYSGSSSRGTAQDSSLSNLYVPLDFEFIESSPLEVGEFGWVQFYVSDHTSSPVSGLTVYFVVRDPFNIMVYQAYGITGGNGLVNFTYTPVVRGENNFTLTSDRQGWFESSSGCELLVVYEQPVIEYELLQEIVAPSSNILVISIMDSEDNGIEGVSIHTIVQLEGDVLLDVINTTLANGTVTLNIETLQPGLLTVSISMEAQSWLFASNSQWIENVLGVTELNLNTIGLPIDQGTVLGIQVTLLDWQGLPISGAIITIAVEWSNGTIIESKDRTTGVDGTCAIAHTFDLVGDFLITALYTGQFLNASANDLVVQRVTVTPNLVVIHPPTSTVDTEMEFQIGIQDANGCVAGRILTLTLQMGGSTVFETQVPSEYSLVSIHWTPSERGFVTIVLTHVGDEHYLDNTTISTMSSLEQVSGQLLVDSDTVDLFDSLTMFYCLSETSDISGVTIVFEVLGMDLVPVWSTQAVTNTSGIAEASYNADDIPGILTIRVEPEENQFLIGGGVLSQLTVMTSCSVSTSIEPAPAALGEILTIIVEGEDGLGEDVDGVQIRVYLNDPYGQPIKLGAYTNYIVVTLEDGLAEVTFTPSLHGSHEVIVESTGNSIVHGFTYSEFHTVHNPSTITFTSITTDLQVDAEFTVTIQLVNHFNEAMEGMIVTITLGTLDPVDLVTDEYGEVYWSSIMTEEGQFTILASFSGAGVYLSSSDSKIIDVRYGTTVTAMDLSTGEIIAGVTPLSVSVILEDDDGTPLELATITYSVYHDQLGFVFEDSVILQGQTPEEFDIYIDRMGSYTIVFSFAGSQHYFPSSSAIEIFVRGTSSIIVDGDVLADRASASNVTISLQDELAEILTVSDLVFDLYGPETNLDGRLIFTTYSVDFNITGLPVGQYEFVITLPDSPERIGCIESHEFTITTDCRLEIISQETSARVGEEHIISLSVLDSLDDMLEHFPIYVSLYDPNDREIYGSILSTRTELEPENGLYIIEWTPSTSGNYTLRIEFEGDMLHMEDLLIIIIYTRRSTYFEITLPESMSYSESKTLSVILFGNSVRLSGATVEVQLLNNGELFTEYQDTTGYQGRIQIILENLPAGTITVIALFLGSEDFAPCTISSHLTVYPEVEFAASVLGTSFIEESVSIEITVNILGLSESWFGSIAGTISDPNNQTVKQIFVNVSSIDTVTISFIPYSEGEYVLYLTLSGILLEAEYELLETVLVTYPTLEYIMDPGTAPIVSGGTILLLIGLAFKKRLGNTIDTIPGEWDA